VNIRLPRTLTAYFVRETEYVEPKQWIEDVMIQVEQTQASITIVMTPAIGQSSEEDITYYEDST
jgi:hypothetical protein